MTRLNRQENVLLYLFTTFYEFLFKNHIKGLSIKRLESYINGTAKESVVRRQSVQSMHQGCFSCC